MLIRPSRDVAAQPKVWLTSWRVFETDRGTRHFICQKCRAQHRARQRANFQLRPGEAYR